MASIRITVPDHWRELIQRWANEERRQEAAVARDILAEGMAARGEIVEDTTRWGGPRQKREKNHEQA